MRIALDAMGGDYAPGSTVEGAIEALERTDAEILLVGDRGMLEPMVASHGTRKSRVKVVHASQAIDMHEQVKDSLRKKDSSIAVAMRLVKKGEADAVVSAGHTGAAVGSAIMTWRRLPGIHRPAIAWTIPANETPSILLDVGATVNCKPNHLYEFGVMGSAFATHVIGINRPRVGLLNIGEEATKGNDVTRKAAEMMMPSGLHFTGNAEGCDLMGHDFDVLVCDGFVGNIVLKFGEALAEWILKSIKGEVSKSVLAMLGALAMKPVLQNFKKRIDYSEYGGAPLLGLNGVCVICHGSSNAKAIANGIRVASESVRHELNNHICELLEANGSQAR